jgi:hypothetical protein
LDRTRASITGDLAVAAISSTGGLFTGFTLHGVQLIGPDGAVVVSADSAWLGYDVMSLLTTRTLALRAYNPELSLQRLDDGRWNLLAALASPSDSLDAVLAPSSDSLTSLPDSIEAPGDSLAAEFKALTGGLADLEDVRIVNGTVRIEQADGEWLVFDAIEAVVPELELGLASGSDRADISSLSMRGHFEDGLLDVRTLRGVLLREGSILDLEASRLELADSQGKGTVRFDWTSPEGVEVALALDVRQLSMTDLHWLDAAIPAGSGTGALEAQLSLGRESKWRFSGLELESGTSKITGAGGLNVRSGEVVLESVDARATNLDLRLFGSWLSADGDSLTPWLDTRVSGPVRLSGPLTDLSIATTLDVVPMTADSSVSVTLRGGLIVGSNPGARDLRVVARGFDLSWLTASDPSSTPLTGILNVDGRVTGRIQDGLELTGDVLRLGGNGSSVLRVDGTVSNTSEGWPVSGLVLFEPLRMEHVAMLAPQAQLRGSATGAARLSGTLSNLTVVTDLETAGGPLNVQVRLDAFAPAAGVHLAGDLEGIDLSALSGRFPEPTTLRGSMDADLLFEPTPTGRIAFNLAGSTVGALQVHRSVFGGVARDGVFVIDSLDVRTSAADLSGTGTIALVDSLPPGEVLLHVASGSLEGLRPFLFGDSILVSDALTDFDREFLDLSGIDADTLPTAEQVQVAGTAEGDFRLVGHLSAWGATGRIDLADAVYGKYQADSAALELSDFQWPSRGFALEAQTGETRVWERAYRSGEFEVAYAAGSGRFTGALIRTPEEDIRVRAGFVLGDSTTVVNLDQATIRSGGERWNLGGPASASWGSNGLSVSDFRLMRPGDGGLRLTIEGTLPRSGDGDLRVSALRVDLGRVASLLQYEDQGVGGMLDLRLRLRGSPEIPLMNGTVDAQDVSFRSVTFTEVSGEVRYADQALSTDLVASIEDSLALVVSGTLPSALSLAPGFEARLVDAPIDMSVEANSVPLDAVLGFFDGYEDVRGTITGTVDITGRPDDLQPDGELKIADGAASITFFGTRPTQFNGKFVLSRDGQVAVDASFTEEGAGQIAGTIDLNPLSDPGFDLDITANRLRAVARRDVEGVVTGSANLGGSFTRPVITGALNADEGTLFIDEFVRSSEVFDLNDPTLDLDLAFDTTFGQASDEPDDVNPFLQNLLADVSLTMVRNTWLRSERLNQAMNVELAGTVDMSFDRGERSLAMLGGLQAVRGTYTTLGRNFTVEQGTVRFVGTPGVNPDLEFTADFRVRRDEGPLDITANVGGTLLQPSLRLSSDDQALSESDLYSYVFFGQPTYALSSGQQAAVGQAGVNLALGTIANQLGSFLLAEDLPIDYIDISTSQYFDPTLANSGLETQFESTGVTLGQYVSDDVFLGVRWRPFGAGGANRNAFSGRLEWRFRDEWAFEAFAEDRSLGRSFTSLDALGFDLSKVFGFFVFREWGY